MSQMRVYNTAHIFSCTNSAYGTGMYTESSEAEHEGMYVLVASSKGAAMHTHTHTHTTCRYVFLGGEESE